MSEAGAAQKMHDADHDLLIRIETKLDIYTSRLGEHERNVREEFSRLWEQKAQKDIVQLIQSKVDLLDTVKASRSDLKGHIGDNEKTERDHEARLRRVERWGLVAIGALLTVQFLSHFVKPF